MISLHSVHAGYFGCNIIREIDIAIKSGVFYAIVGPNGSGKSTLLHTISGQLTPYQGQVIFDGKNLHSLSAKERAKRISVLTQVSEDGSELTVRERVALGRLPHQSLLFPIESEHDRLIIEQEIKQNDIEIYTNQMTNRLSGGEQQRVRLAKTFVQQTQLILLDEPTNHLDMQHTLDLLQSLKTIVEKSKLTVIAVLHDINLAARFADVIAIMNYGKIVKLGSPSQCLDEDTIREVFSIDTYMVMHPTLHCPQFLVK